jgi:oligopeptidase B
LILNTAAQVTSETHILDLSEPLNGLRVLFTRREKVQYTIEHHSFPDSEPNSQDHRGYFYVLTNENSKNMQLYRIPVPSEKEWSEKYLAAGIDVDSMLEMKEVVIENRDFVLIEAFQVRARHLIVFERSNCMQNIRVVNLDPGIMFVMFEIKISHYINRRIRIRQLLLRIVL